MAKKPAKTTKKTKRAIPHLYKERHPESHSVTGKYTFLYLFFAACTLVFALTAIYLYSVAHDIVKRYDNFVQYTKQNSTKYEGEINE